MKWFHFLCLLSLALIVCGCARTGVESQVAMEVRENTEPSNCPVTLHPQPSEAAASYAKVDGVIIAVDDASLRIFCPTDQSTHDVITANLAESSRKATGGKDVVYPDYTYPFPSYMYLPEDLMVGDQVVAVYRKKDGENILDVIRIEGRPGGLIPPARIEPFRRDRPYHLVMQAYQDHREKGTPIPDKLEDLTRKQLRD